MTSETHNMECFRKIVIRWIQSTIFAESCILDVLLSSEYVSYYLGAFSMIINSDCYFESFKNLSSLIGIFFKYIEQTFSPLVQ